MLDDQAPRTSADESADEDVVIDLRVFERERLSVDFQPVVDLLDGLIVGAEALMRWNHPGYGAMAAAEFLELAVNRSVRPQLAERAVILAAGAWADLRDRIGPSVPDLYLNLDATQLDDSAAVERLRHVLVACDLPAEHVVVDVVPSRDGLDLDATRPVLHGLTDLGVRVALDDFGNSSTSLMWLRELPVTIVKFDGALVRDVDTDERARRMLTRLAELALSLELDAIVEGVETSVEDEVVREAGFRYAQGFRYYRPMPLSRLAGELESMGSAVGSDR